MDLFKQRTPPDVDERIRHAIEDMRPMLHIETMDIDLVEFEPEQGIAVLRVAGDCPDCDLTAEMLSVGIEAHLKMQVPEIQSVRTVAR